MTTKDLQEKMHAMTPTEQGLEIRRMFRQTFSTPTGRIVLAYMLDDLCWHQHAETIDDQALRNYAVFLLRERLGIQDTLAATTALLKETPA